MLLPETLKVHHEDQFDFHYAYFLPWKNQMVDSIQQNGGKVICFDAKDNIQLIMKVRAVTRYVRENNIQLIHAHLPWAGILARLVGRITKVPIIYTEHNKQERYHFATRKMNLLTMDLLQEVIAVSDDVAVSIRKHKPKLDTPVRVILNGVNTDHFSKASFVDQQIRESLNIPSDAPIIGTIAVFRFQKRLDVWMELAARILETLPNAHFIIVGDGPLKAELIKKRETLALADRIHMPGLETEVRPYFAVFDLYMMTSVFEGLPIALLEAMSMQCPVISTGAGGIAEVIRHETDGLLCPVDEPEQLIKYAISLMNDEGLRKKYGDQGRRRVMECFSMEKMVEELEAVYRSYQ